MISNTVASNTAANGAGFYVADSDAQIKGNTVTNNRAWSRRRAMDAAAAVYLGPGAANITQNVFQSNEAIYGGGCYFEDTAASLLPKIRSIRNSGGPPAAAFISTTAAMRPSAPTRSPNNAANGTGESDGGGGLYLESSNTGDSREHHTGNRAATGGGVYLFSFSNASLDQKHHHAE